MRGTRGMRREGREVDGGGRPHVPRSPVYAPACCLCRRSRGGMVLGSLHTLKDPCARVPVSSAEDRAAECTKSLCKGCKWSVYKEGLSTGSLYRVYLQGLSTGSIYRVYLQGLSTGSIYRVYLQGLSTGSMYRVYLPGQSTKVSLQGLSTR
jgi:hypothetical protein